MLKNKAFVINHLTEWVFKWVNEPAALPEEKRISKRETKRLSKGFITH